MPKPGEDIKHYRLLRLIGKGGMGEVFLARDTSLDRQVAIKFLSEQMKADPAFRQRFVHEARAAAALDHPFIGKVFEAGELADESFIVMEYVEGQPLDQKLKEGPLPVKEAIQISLEIAEALEVAQAKRIVHRDLKPSNIMLTTQGHAKVMDFGLAKQLPAGPASVSRTLTQASLTGGGGSTVGTLAYMSPEQTRGDPLDGRSDIFSLGIMLYEMVCGRHPFMRSSPADTSSAILRDPPPPLKVKPPSVNSMINPVLRRALAKKPDDRYSQASELVSDLRQILERITTGKGALAQILGRAAAGVAALGLIVAGLLWVAHRRPESAGRRGPEPVSVLVADFQNSTGDPVFDNALEETMGILLGGASFMDVRPHAQARKLATAIDPASQGQVDSRMAQLICRREGLDAIITGSIARRGQGYTIRIQALDSRSSRTLSEVVKGVKTKAEVIRACDGLAAKIGSDLGGQPAKQPGVLVQETFTTSSLEAMESYARAQELSALGKDEEAIQAYLQAIAQDKNFGRAYAGLGTEYYNRGQESEGEKYFKEALARIDQMTDREKYRTRGVYYIFKRNAKKAIEEYQALIRQFPLDDAGYSNLALAYFLDFNMKRAYEVGVQAAEKHPRQAVHHYNLGWYALAYGDLPRAQSAIEKTQELNPAFTESYVVLSLIKMAQGSLAEAAETYRLIASFDSYGKSLAATGLADMALYEGRREEALSILRPAVDSDIRNGWTSTAADKYLMIAQALAAQNRKTEALAFIDKAAELKASESLDFCAAWQFLELGREDRARPIMDRLEKKLEPAFQAYAKILNGELLLKKGDFPQAIRLFQEAQATADMWLGRFLLGRAYLDSKNFAEAHSEFELCLKRKGESASVFFNDLPSFRYFPLVYYYLGRAQEGLGSPAARESYKKFLDIKSKADPGDPLVEDARRRLGGL